jgi:hypothetical protein
MDGVALMVTIPFSPLMDGVVIWHNCAVKAFLAGRVVCAEYVAVGIGAVRR